MSHVFCSWYLLWLKLRFWRDALLLFKTLPDCNTIFRLKLVKIRACRNYHIFKVFVLLLYWFSSFCSINSWCRRFKVSPKHFILRLKCLSKFMNSTKRPHSLWLFICCLGCGDERLEWFRVGLSNHNDVSMEIKSVRSFASVISFLELILTHYLLCFLISECFLLLLEFSCFELLYFSISHCIYHVNFFINLLILWKSNLNNFILFIYSISFGFVSVKVNACESIFRLRASGLKNFLDILLFFICHVHRHIYFLKLFNLHVCIYLAWNCLVILHKGIRMLLTFKSNL